MPTRHEWQGGNEHLNCLRNQLLAIKPFRYRRMICVPRAAPNFSVWPSSASDKYQTPDDIASPSESTSASAGVSASDVVNVAIVFARPNVLSLSVSDSVTRTPFPAANASVCAVRSGAESAP